MGKIMRQWKWVMGCIASVAVLVGAAAAQPERPSMQLFSTLDRSAVAVGAPFVLTVEAYAAFTSEEAAVHLEAAFEAAQLSGGSSAVELVRRKPVERRLELVEGGVAVLALTQRYVLRVHKTGQHEVPEVRVAVEGHTQATRAYRVNVYEVDDAFFRAARAIVPIVAVQPLPNRRRAYVRTGSAFLLAPDMLVTSFHVVLNADYVRVRLPDGRRITTDKVWHIDPVRDIALLSVDPKPLEKAGLKPLRLAPSFSAVTLPHRRVAAPQMTFTNGWPGGVQRSTAGIRYHDARLPDDGAFWITSNPVRPGDSGGPLLNLDGYVLGVVTSGATSAQADVLRENVCMATDPRPALGAALLMRKPRRLRDVFQDPAFSAEPHVVNHLLTATVLFGRQPMQNIGRMLEQLDTAADDDVGLLFSLGSIYLHLGTEAQAVDAFQTVLDRFQDHFPAAYVLGRHAFNTEQYAQAERLFEQTQRYAPYEHLATYGLARVYMRRHRYRAAIAALNDVLHYDATYSPALYYLAYCHLALGEEKAVHELLARLYGVSPAWAHRLRQVLRTPALRPAVLRPLPRASLPATALSTASR